MKQKKSLLKKAKHFYPEDHEGGTSATVRLSEVFRKEEEVSAGKTGTVAEEMNHSIAASELLVKSRRFRDKSPLEKEEAEKPPETASNKKQTDSSIVKQAEIGTEKRWIPDRKKQNSSKQRQRDVIRPVVQDLKENQVAPEDEDSKSTVQFVRNSADAVLENQTVPWLKQQLPGERSAYRSAVQSAKELENQLNRNNTTQNPLMRSIQKRRNYYTARKRMGLRNNSVLNNTVTRTAGSVAEGFQPVRRAKEIWSGLKWLGGGFSSLLTGAAGGVTGLIALSPILIVPVIVLFTFSWMFQSGDPYVNSTYVNKVFHERIQEMIEAYRAAPTTKMFPGIDMPEANREVVLDNDAAYTLDASKLTALFMAYIGSDYSDSYAALKMNEWLDELYHVDSYVVHEQRNCRADPLHTGTQVCDDVPIYHLLWTEEITSDSEFDAFAKEVLRTAPRQDLDYTAVIQQYENYIEEYGGIQVFMNPLGAGKTAAVNSPWGYRDMAGQAPFHNGVDLNVGMRTPLYAVYDGGVVKEAGWVNTGGGNTVGVLYKVHGQNYYVRYCHMDQITCHVGEEVNIGTQLGYSGTTGNSTGPHLHLEVWKGTGAYGLNKSINPLYIVQNTAY